MRKEIYKVKCPQHSVFGDPMYFERFRGNELNRLTVDYRPSKYFDTARLVLKEEPNRELSEYMNRSITLYAAPRQTIDVYACEQIYTFQKISAKNIGVDTARYYLNIDGREAEIKTGGDGWWGRFEEYYREAGKDRLSDAVVLTIAMPEEYDFEGMKHLAGYFFGNLQPILSKKQQKKEKPTR